MGKVISTLGTLFGSENRWWEQEKQREKQKEQERRKYNMAQRMKQIEQQALQKAQQKQTGPAYGQTHDPNKEYKETQANVLGAIASVSKQPGVPKAKPPYVVQNRDAITNPSKVKAFTQEAKQWSLKNLSTDKQDLFWQLSITDKIRVMESQNPDNELNYLSRGR